MKKLLLFTLFISAASMSFAAPSYTVKLTGKVDVPSEDTLSFQTSKGWKNVYFFGLDKKSEAALDKAIKKKSCVRITENATDSEMHMGAVIRSIDCPKK